MATANVRNDSRRGAHHDPLWYREEQFDDRLLAGDRMFIPCRGGPCTSRSVNFPPPLEIKERGGLYVLDDHGHVREWIYEFVAT